MATYNPKSVTVTFKDRVITGFADGDVITASRDVDEFTKQMGIYGEGGFVQSPDPSGKVVLKLLAFSPSNKYLSDVQKSDSLTGDGVGALIIRDNNTDAASVMALGRIMKMPDFARGKEAGTIEWSFVCTDIQISHDGITV